MLTKNRHDARNPFFVKAIARHMSNNCAKFSTNDEMDANESKHSWYESFQEYCSIIDKSVALFISKTAGVENEEALIKALSESGEENHRALLDSLIARTDYETYCAKMKEKRAVELAAVLGRMEDAAAAGSAQAAKK